MLQAYVDESGTGNKDGFFVMAGYIAPAEVWAEKFAPEWQKMLDLRPPHHSYIESFKMNQMLDDPERCSWFYRVIEDNLTAALSCTVSISDLRKAVDEFPWPDWLYNIKVLRNPYYFAFKAITDMLAQHQHHLGITEPVDFIFDDIMHEKKACILAWDSLKRNSRPEVARLMGDTPIFRNDKTTLPLQAADLYAYWVREWENKGMTDGIEKLRFNWLARKVDTFPRIDFKFQERDFLIEFNKIWDPEVQRRMMEDETDYDDL